MWKIRSAGKSSHMPQESALSDFGHKVTDGVDWMSKENGGLNSYAGIDYNGMLWEYKQCETLSEMTEEEHEELMVAMENILFEGTEIETQEKGAALFEDFKNSFVQENISLLNSRSQFQIREDGLLCPICKIGHLHQIQGLIYCNCGHLRVEVGTEKGNVEFLRGRLEEISKQHLDLGCKNHPVFCMDNRFSVTALYMQCSSCDMFELVL